jgi:hypothetical protein
VIVRPGSALRACWARENRAPRARQTVVQILGISPPDAVSCLDGLNVAVIVHTPGPMADGNWTLAAYIDERANDSQTAALGAIFGGAEGGPMAAFAPLVGNHLGAQKVAINYAINGKARSAEIPGILRMAVEPLPTMHPSGEAWAAIGHPVAPDKLALAVGSSGSTFTDHGMRWDNSGKNGHYAPISWSN